MRQRVSAFYGPVLVLAASIPMLASASCDSTSGPASMDASAESSAPADAAGDGRDAADDGADAADDGGGATACAAGEGLVCPAPVSTCTSNCPTQTWVVALEACAHDTSPAASAVQLFTCGAYDGVLTTTIARGEFDYYDHASGELVAETIYINGVSTCLYGPSCFVSPSDCTSLPPCGPTPDAGAYVDAAVEAAM